MPTDPVPESKTISETFKNLFVALLVFFSEGELSVTEARQSTDSGSLGSRLHRSLSRSASRLLLLALIDHRRLFFATLCTARSKSQPRSPPSHYANLPSFTDFSQDEAEREGQRGGTEMGKKSE